MKRFLSVFLLSVMFSINSYCDDVAPAPRVSIFSTSTDWEAVTGRQLHEYYGEFRGRSSLVGRGMVLYYLDGFPCYGLGGSVRAWIDPKGGSNDRLRLACIAAPKTINFAWLNASRDADDKTTTGLLTCTIDSDNGRHFVIDLADCTRGPDWNDYE